MKWKFIAVTLAVNSILATPSFAFFCPSNFNDINIGDPISKVIELCGQPDSKVVKDAPDKQPQEWSYYMANQPNQLQIPTAAQGTLKTTIAFDAEGKVMNISVNNIGVATTNKCGTQVSLGDTREQVESACGKPTLISKQNQNEPPVPPPPAGVKPEDLPNKQVEFTYNSTPAMTLIFIDGRLTERQ